MASLERLKEEVLAIAEREGISERGRKILIWLVEETHGREGRIEGPELRRELERLGKEGAGGE